MDFQKLRNKMVEEQLVKRGISQSLVLEAFRRVPRHEFIPKNLLGRSYDDNALPIGEGQTISQPYIVALMTQALNLDKNKIVLEIGTGSGYQTAILAQVSKEVYTIEKIKELADQAKDKLEKLNYANVHFLIADGTLGWPDPSLKFDAVMVTAASPNRLDHLFDQMNNQGRLVIPIGNRESQILTLFVKDGPTIKEEKICGCIFVPLTGRYGWN